MCKNTSLYHIIQIYGKFCYSFYNTDLYTIAINTKDVRFSITGKRYFNNFIIIEISNQIIKIIEILPAI